MKKLIFAAFLCVTSVTLFAQQQRYHRNVPPEVQRSYQKDYPNYNDNASWDMRNNQWHTRYKDRDHNNRDVDVYYDRRGQRVMTQSRWDRDDLPANVREGISRRYHRDQYEAYRIERPGRGVFFQITLGGNKKVYFDENGREVRHY
jgi:hypothetical protein